MKTMIVEGVQYVEAPLIKACEGCAFYPRDSCLDIGHAAREAFGESCGSRRVIYIHASNGEADCVCDHEWTPDEVVQLLAEKATEKAVYAARLLTYGWHTESCAFVINCDPCDCGFEELMREALTINKAARKGEGE